MTETGDPGPRRNDPPPPRPESPIQLIQGCYYLAAGLGVAIGLAGLQTVAGPQHDIGSLWFVRLIAAVVAAAGAGLIVASRRVEPVRAAAGGAMALALILALLEGAGLAAGILPTTFLLDIGMQLGFLAWWVTDLYLTARPADPRLMRAWPSRREPLPQ